MLAAFWFAIASAASRYEKYLTIKNPEINKIVMENNDLRINAQYVISLSLFTLLFKLSIGLYRNRYIWRFLNRKTSLDGPWIYVFEDDAQKVVIIGFFEFEHTFDTLKLERGICWYATTAEFTEENRRGTLTSDEVAIGQYYWIVYHMIIRNSTPGTEESEYTGLMQLKLQEHIGIKRKTLEGILKNHNSNVDHKGLLRAKKLDSLDAKFIEDWGKIREVASKYFDIDFSK